MAYQDIKPGQYIAKPIQGQFAKSKEKGTPCIGILFEFERGRDENGLPLTEKMWWTGWLTATVGKDGKTPLERSMEVLALCGFDENKGHDANGTVPKEHFDPKAEVQITIEPEPYVAKDGTAKTTMKIKWVNRVGGGQFGAVDPQEMKNILAGVNLKAEMAAAKAKLGIKTPPAPRNFAPGASNPAPAAQQKPSDGEPPAFNADEEIPF